MPLNDYEDMIHQQVGIPIQQATGQGANAVEGGIDQAGQAAMQKIALLKQMTDGSAAPQAAPPVPPIPNVQANDPNMSPQDQQSRMQAMIAAPLSGGTSLNLDDAQAQRDKMLQMYNAASAEKAAGSQEPDLSGYSDVPQQNAARQFPHIQKKIQSGQPINSQDIRATLKGPQEVTPELEKKLGYGSKDEDEE